MSYYLKQNIFLKQNIYFVIIFLLVVSCGKAPFGGLTFPEPNKSPIANAGGNQTVTLGNPVILDGSNSFGPDGSPFSFFWVILEEPFEGIPPGIFPATTEKVTFTPQKIGTYKFNLSVLDSDFAASFDGVAIIVVPAPGLLAQ
ncbi:MAG: PKD domain-containing protein [Ignavibacteria bacterium]|nr:PKD domain-containing protein [Ignavibacteria bacterium]